MVRIGILVVVASLAAVGWASWHWLGGWSFLVLPLAAFLFFKLAGGWLMGKVFLIPFRAKGAPLRGAAVTVHGVTPREPASLEETAEVGAPSPSELRWFEVEATITPAGDPTGPFLHWQPGDLRLNEADADPLEEGARDENCTVSRVEVEEGGAFRKDEGEMIAGPARVRLLVSVSPGIYRLSFFYFLEKFGELRLAG